MQTAAESVTLEKVMEIAVGLGIVLWQQLPLQALHTCWFYIFSYKIYKRLLYTVSHLFVLSICLQKQ